MRPLKLTVAYDGTAYAGWQRQLNRITIQQLLEEALQKLAGCHVTIHGSGRTDAGVHAKAQVASCSFSGRHPSSTICRALNAHLPDDIRVLRVQTTPAQFHARFSAKRKEYRYQIDCGEVADPFLRRYAWHHGKSLNVLAMRRAARVLKGRHDFTALSAKSDRNPVRTITRLSLTKSGHLLTIAMTANGFLYKMARSIVGALVKVGEEKLTVEQLAALLADKKRSAIIETAPAHGLCLWRIWY